MKANHVHGLEIYQLLSIDSFEHGQQFFDIERLAACVMNLRDAGTDADCVYIVTFQFCGPGGQDKVTSLTKARILSGEDEMETVLRMAKLVNEIEDIDELVVKKVGDRAFTVVERSPAEKLARREAEEFHWLFGATLPDEEIARPRPGL
ncbi:hypothetical protein LXA47_31310 [Massilia sp. P8910]|uniref:hypothetical protein n=1 Tax=Massilia antarctica TaxID=2765360 RepID=UPI001E3BE74D|nr:hypothetical protein [Massilia antarctica]MCE3608060.1 hypothetical protein [Massilia antarctica]